MDYLSEDTDDSYFLRYTCYEEGSESALQILNFRGVPSECLTNEIDEFENSYNLSPLFEPDLYPDFYRNDDLSVADDW